MNFLWDKVTEWLKELLIGSIMSNLTGLFDNVNRQVAGIADNGAQRRRRGTAAYSA